MHYRGYAMSAETPTASASDNSTVSPCATGYKGAIVDAGDPDGALDPDDPEDPVDEPEPPDPGAGVGAPMHGTLDWPSR